MAALQTRAVLHRVIYCTLLVLLMTATSQEQDCNVFRPTQYAYDRTQIENSNTDSETCNTQEINGRTYYICNEEGRVRDQDLGPQTLSLQDSRHYYNWTKTGGRMLFEFSRSVTLTSVILHYYLDESQNASRPKLKLVELDNSFNLSHIADTLPKERTPTDLEPLANIRSVTPGLYNVTIALRDTRAPASKVVLVVFNDKLYHFVTSEITFCTEESVTNPSTAFVSSPPSPTNKGTVAEIIVKSTTQRSEGMSDSSVEPQSGTSGQKQLKTSIITFLIALSILLLLR